MKKKLAYLMATCLLVVSPTYNVGAEVTESVTTGGYYYRFASGVEKNAKRYSLLDSYYYNKKKDIHRKVEISEAVESSASLTIEASVSSTVGAEVNIFGQKGNAELSASVSTGLGVTNSVSKGISTSVEYDLKKSKDHKGYYVYETFTKGYATYMKYIKVECNTGKVLKNNKNIVSYIPRKGYRPTGQYNNFNSDPQLANRYEHDYSN